MKGLFKSEYYSALGNLKLFLLLVLGTAAAFIITGSPTAQELFVYITIAAFPANAMATMRRDAGSKWNRYQITLPVRRLDIIRCKYLSYLLCVGAGVVIALVTTLAARLIHGAAVGLASMFFLGIGIAVLTGSIFYLLAYLFGIERSETFLAISMLGAVGTSIAALNLLHRLKLSQGANILIFALFYMCCFLASYLVSRRAFLTKEY